MTDKFDDIKKQPQWTAWRYIERVNPNTGDAKLTKPPVNAGYDPYADANDWGSCSDPSTWYDYQTVSDYVDANPNSTDGIGLVFANGLAGVDLDDVIVDGEVIPEAMEVIKALHTYTEISPSGTGVHALLWIDESARYSPSRKRGGFVRLPNGILTEIEAYTMGRFFTITENPLPGYDIPIRTDRVTALKDFQQIVDKYLSKTHEKDNKPANPPSLSVPSVFTSDDDQTLWRRMFASGRGEKIKDLFNANYDNYHEYPSKSEADLGLCAYLAYWTDCNAERMDRMYRMSRMYDPSKWDIVHNGTDTYGQMTVNKAIENCTDYRKTGDISSVGLQSPRSHYYPSLSDYRTEYREHRDKGFSPYKTPFPALDTLLGGGLYPELYVLGAATGSGKTSLVLQLGDYIAHSEIPVLYTALEMSLDELIAKSISRLSYDVALSENTDGNMPYVNQARSTNQILWHHADTDAVRFAEAMYFTEYAPNIAALEGVGNISTAAIRIRANELAEATGKAPLVVVDYLQLLASDNPYGTEKQAADHNVTALKQLSRELTCPVFLISSLNRMSTKEQRDEGETGQSKGPELESFKESGGIEYTAGVAIGMWNKKIIAGETQKIQTTLRLLKHRHNGVHAGKDKVELEFLGDRSTFRPWDDQTSGDNDDSWEALCFK